MKIERKNQKCGNCDAFIPQGPPSHGNGECHDAPPLMMQVMLPNPKAMLDPKQPPAVPGMQCVWPPTHISKWCRRWGLHHITEGLPENSTNG